MELRTDRAGLLLDQLTQSAGLSQARMEGLTDEEYSWEPVDGMWSIRPRGEAITSGAFGPGDWVMDFEPRDPFAPGPPTTIAWRVEHLATMFAGRYEWTFGSRVPPDRVVDFSPRSDEALTRLWGWVERWTEGVEGLSDQQLDTVGLSQYPWGMDPDIPFVALCWWVNREFVHHMAEVALLRDLYPHRSMFRP